MGHLAAHGLSYTLPDGRTLFSDVSFRVSGGDVVALIGANGAGKTTVLRILAGDLAATKGGIQVQGGLGVMPQFIGSVRDDSTVRDLLLAAAPAALRRAAARLDRAEPADSGDERAQLAYAEALTAWGDAGGYDLEVRWDKATTTALGLPIDRAAARAVTTLSGGEQKRLVLEALLRGPEQVLVLDEPDNYLDVPGKLWLEEQLAQTDKAVLLVSHDRELLTEAATHIVTMEAGTAWTHGGTFATWHTAREARWERIAELHRRWGEEHQKLKDLVRRLQQQSAVSDAMTSRYHAAQTRLEKFEKAGPPAELPRRQKLALRLRGARTGVRAIHCERLELTGLMKPFDLEVSFGERVCVLGSNGSGKSHFLRLLAESVQDAPTSVEHSGDCRLGARVVPGLFAQTHRHPAWSGRTLVDVLARGEDGRAGVDLRTAMAALGRYGLAAAGERSFETLSGGQQARFQVLLLELSGATLLLLDEPTDNLDLASAEALQEALAGFEGTVVAVTHDRWFAKSFDRFLVFRADGRVAETDTPVWDERRVVRQR
ncbi:ABC-F family ATP-binding cassette domain-containing protein [Kitasatospora sp. NPDC057904]|uniref:ABC-F family ATP-binding cassette domain-containing protein n=1 Tax=Kitasatospora sp. NPDC057904 TaxID=3346275 RepID=UPI0036D9B5C6